VNKSRIDVAIIGAGPYGLALAHHLQRRGVGRAIFGRPMQFWRDMPGGMFLKSFGFATSIATADGSRTLPEYCRARSLEDEEPIAISTFAEYGLEVQRALIPDVEAQHVMHVAREAGGFGLELENGERIRASHVVVATGLTHCESIAPQLMHLAPEFISHTGQHKTFVPFDGKDVVVIGAGQSALQAAALLHEAGARVHVLARERVSWNTRAPLARPLFDRLRNPNTPLGAGRDNWVLTSLPWLFPRLKEERRVSITRRHLGPSGAWWLRDRVDGVVTVQEQSSIVSARERGDRLVVDVRHGSGCYSMEADHIIAGTGYEADVDRLPFLGADLRAAIARTQRAPRLSLRFESSVPGLFFVGPLAAFSFGPVSRFVAGSRYAAQTLSRHLRTRVRRRPGAAAVATPATVAASVQR
jgi:cation diffusion facilitator CzcD-associated flavoprotein CzcO